MEEFLAVALSFPTVCFSALLIVAGLYWISVLLGVADIDMLGGADAIEAAAGKAEGIVDAIAGKLDAAAHAAAGKAEAVADSIADAATAKAEALDHVVDEGPLALILSALRLRRAPVTVSMSVVVLVGWIVTFFAARYVGPALPLSSTLSGVVCLAIGLAVAWPVAAAVTFPMGTVYSMQEGVRRVHLVGRTVTVVSSRVDASYGEGELHDGGAGLLLQIRCTSENTLGRGDEALLVAWEEANEVYDVEPLSRVLEARADRS